VKFGFVVPYADAGEFADLAALGERTGWDGVFTWESVWGVDAWVSLAAAAMVTEHIRLGTLLTPAPRVKPWDLASRVATVDRLSNGRAILSVGLGAPNPNWTAFEEDAGRAVRAQQLDECLTVYDGLLRGQPFSFTGRHFRAEPTDCLVPPPPAQHPRPPVWVVGAYVEGRDRQPSLARAARWDGLIPQVIDGNHRGKVRSPDELAGILTDVRALRAESALPLNSYDVILEADSTGEWEKTEPPDPQAWRAAGVTWWIESWWSIERGPEGLAEVRRRVNAGPPSP
jgi:Luciferase-like monooxygenase